MSQVDPKETDVKISETYNADDADLVLVSSDEIHFKVHSYYLKAASVVFRAMLDSPNLDAKKGDRPLPTIYLTDNDIETAEVLEGALGIIYERPFPPDPAEYRDELRKIIPLLRKYECDGTIARIRLLLHSWITYSNHGAWSAFLVSVAMDDIVTCARAMRRAGKCGLSGSSVLQGAQKSTTVFDLGSLSLTTFSKIPGPTVWAILRATKSQPTSTEGWNEIADQFLKLLEVKAVNGRDDNGGVLGIEGGNDGGSV
ncbi:hypothetical protein TREMEDRAFT_61871 [Tremella mesenterica DSM 1558]|uniref:uncharacterized protein n=1 Tax=Tremella mesenterica (strain ATCC 24925 / CBS 8224 / DSM 1558 / NBRC 9311 / NRRL Y-6157 / RJB 2259-6 / UBC 559-6) TaxID=578456 RepID=UPI0003F49DBE|nr:uncharacterized protein TREMEDRAFT_61871 [Tremella mesenterica DSM 1558]EIW70109.1 hypothetical protein TREMEDRAFT_61871 [Tremella mesenterica DSM 1558]